MSGEKKVNKKKRKRKIAARVERNTKEKSINNLSEWDSVWVSEREKIYFSFLFFFFFFIRSRVQKFTHENDQNIFFLMMMKENSLGGGVRKFIQQQRLNLVKAHDEVSERERALRDSFGVMKYPHTYS